MSLRQIVKKVHIVSVFQKPKNVSRTVTAKRDIGPFSK